MHSTPSAVLLSLILVAAIPRGPADQPLPDITCAAGYRNDRPAGNSLGTVIPMDVSIDADGRIAIPKVLQDALGLSPGSTVGISRYGAGLYLVPAARNAQLADESGALVATGGTQIDDDVVFGLIDSGRR
jgi:AbrB family looped-hinge helix DNA binding protein